MKIIFKIWKYLKMFFVNFCFLDIYIEIKRFHDFVDDDVKRSQNIEILFVRLHFEVKFKICCKDIEVEI